MFEKIIGRFSGLLLILETRFGRVRTSAAIGFILLVCAGFYGSLSFTPQYHGIQFSLLSENPFDFTYNNPLRYRILAPLLGYLTYLRGPYFFILPIIFCFLFISSVYCHFRNKKFSPSEAFLTCCLISFSCLILIPLFAPGYTDIVTYFFIFLSFSKIKNIALSSIYFSLALLNHECALFLLPGLILYSLKENSIQIKRVYKTVQIYLLACIPHLLYRYFVNQHIHPMYNASFYFSETNIHAVLGNLRPFFLPAVFYAFKISWVIPVIYIYSLFVKKQFHDLIIILTIIGGAFAQLIIAYDYTRMIVLAFPAIILAIEHVKEIQAKRFSVFCLLLIILNLLIPQYQYNFDGAVKIANKENCYSIEKSSTSITLPGFN